MDSKPHSSMRRTRWNCSAGGRRVGVDGDAPKRIDGMVNPPRVKRRRPRPEREATRDADTGRERSTAATGGTTRSRAEAVPGRGAQDAVECGHELTPWA